MNKKECGELRRRLSPDKNSITKIYAVYVNNKKEIQAESELSLGLMPQDDAEKYLGLFKRALSGTVGKNLLTVSFSTHDVTDGDAHKRLMHLRDTALEDEAARKALVSDIIESVSFDDRYFLILLAADAYDVPEKSFDALGGEGETEAVYRYILCAVCPVGDVKSALGYDAREKAFHCVTSPRAVASPELGFLFPAFDDRRTNIYDALVYSRDTASVPQALIDAVFAPSGEPLMSAKEQKNTFGAVMAEALEDDCRFEVLQAVHEQIRERLEQHKESRDPEPLDVTAKEVGDILISRGVPEAKVEAFREKCAENFGKRDVLNAENIVDTGKFELETPQVRIAVDPAFSYLVETRNIDGTDYILIPANDGVTVNGVAVTVGDDKKGS